MNLQPARKRPQTQQVKQNEKTENTKQMKEQVKNPPDLTNEEEIGSLPEKEFRIMIREVIQYLGNTMEKTQETFKKI